MFRRNALPSAYGYQPTVGREGGDLSKATRLEQTRHDMAAFARLFPGKALPDWWPLHPGIGKCITHVIRTIDETHGTDLRPTQCGLYGLYVGLAVDFTKPTVKSCVMQEQGQRERSEGQVSPPISVDVD